ncbi:MAG: hypothetical protein R3B47_09560 [Bacteroidia bacterium]
MNSPADIDIVPCRPENWKQVADIYNDYIREGTSTMGRRIRSKRY